MNEDLRNEIVRRWREGASQRVIARTLGVSRGTVKRVLSGHEQARRGQKPATVLIGMRWPSTVKS